MADKMMRIAGRGQDGKARALNTDNMGNMGVRFVDTKKEILNLRGKKRGDLSVPHIVKLAAVEGRVLPSSPTPNEISDDFYERLYEFDDQFVHYYTETVGLTAQALIFIKVSDSDISKLDKIRYTFFARGRGHTDDGAKNGILLHIFNFQTQEYELIGSNNAWWEDVLQTPILGEIEELTNYLNDDGYIVFNLNSAYPAGTNSASFADLHYFEIEITKPVFSNSFGTMGVKDMEGNSVELSAERDHQGRGVLRIVDAAPHGYDEYNDWFRVRDEKSIMWLQELYNEQLKTSTLLEALVGANSLYDEKGERIPFVEGAKEGNATASKEDGYLYFSAQDDAQAAYQTLETSIPIDLTHVRFLVIDWENTGADSELNESRLQVSQSKQASIWNYEKSIILKRRFERQESKLDVSELKGKYYINVCCRDAWSAGPISSELKVYGIRKEV